MFQLECLSANNNFPARSLLLFLLPVLLVAQFIDAYAQSAKVPRVGVLTIISPDRPHFKGLHDGLKAAGYLIGRNLFLDVTQRKNLVELETAARHFVTHRFDVLVATSSNDTLVAQKATRDIPIVFSPADYPLQRGFIESYAKPGRNLTGLSRYSDLEDSGKQLEVLTDLVPKLKSVTVINDVRTQNQILTFQMTAIRRTANRMKITVGEVGVRNGQEMVASITNLGRQSNHGILVNCTGLFANIKGLASRAKDLGLPLQGCQPNHVIDDGALFSYAPDLYQVGWRTAWYVDRILKGARPQDLPVETPQKYELVINLKTARAIGMTIPPVILQRADRVIE